ncbi:hypothetical protein [Cognatishimia sp.]|uniref:hypothetical protein n=1 Tax=Cognatishimia sp. TaxID=2211648 RepID=UPI0035152C04|nr:hypothetical protein [Cognatishimia sp.]
MNSKITNPDLSRKLYKEGFDAENHTGWWVEILGSSSPPESTAEEGFIEEIKWQKRKPGENREEVEDYYKAYDCHDLLNWFYSREEVGAVVLPLFAYDEPLGLLVDTVINILQEQKKVVNE